MDYEFLIEDLNRFKSQKSIGTDKGLAKIGDGIVNLAYSVAKSIFLTKNNLQHKIYRTGSKVSKQILANALKNADMKDFAKNRADAHDLADTGEALVAYVWLSKNLTLNEIIDFLTNKLSGDLTNRSEEIKSATIAFTNLFINIRKFLPEK
ncbi:MAG: hypothetical protein KAT66_10825 [Candidatus Lokiarchaeota archaeon]|nr:hypothetical protein [Candidatus Lokiarchaeota archaeon]